MIEICCVLTFGSIDFVNRHDSILGNESEVDGDELIDKVNPYLYVLLGWDFLDVCCTTLSKYRSIGALWLVIFHRSRSCNNKWSKGRHWSRKWTEMNCLISIIHIGM